MSNTKKYLGDGNINPFYVMELQRENFDLNEGQSEYDRLEDRFQFLVDHSDSPEELALAKKILGI